MKPPSKPSSIDAMWLAARAAPAGLIYVNDVQSSLGDIDAAMEEEDWPTAVESCTAALRSVYTCHRVLGGHQRRCDETELDALISIEDNDIAQRLRALPAGFQADKAAAITAHTSVMEAVGQLETDLPIQFPTIRTPQGFFPNVRIGADLEKLRAQYGLPPLDWITWM